MNAFRVSFNCNSSFNTKLLKLLQLQNPKPSNTDSVVTYIQSGPKCKHIAIELLINRIKICQ